MTAPHILRGNCHCGAFKFAVSLAEPLSTLPRCNCSHCTKLNAFWIEYNPEDLKFELGDVNDLKEYRFGSKSSSFKFCMTCCTTLLYDGTKYKGLNGRALRDFEVGSLPIKTFDGAVLPPVHTPARYGGPEMTIGEGQKVYTGGCHCGNVTMALRTKPIPDVEVRECDCSICTHNGYTFVYPTTDDVGVHVASPDDLTVYQFGGKILKHHFCAVCGVPVFVRVCGPPPDVVAAMSEAEKAGRDQMITMHPVNLHALDGVEWDLLKVNKIQGKEREPKYTID